MMVEEDVVEDCIVGSSAGFADAVVDDVVVVVVLVVDEEELGEGREIMYVQISMWSWN